MKTKIIAITAAIALSLSIMACTPQEKRTTGMLVGGVAGGAIGHGVGGGSAAGTIAGTLGGAYLGGRIADSAN